MDLHPIPENIYVLPHAIWCLIYDNEWFLVISNMPLSNHRMPSVTSYTARSAAWISFTYNSRVRVAVLYVPHVGRSLSRMTITRAKMNLRQNTVHFHYTKCNYSYRFQLI